jgi:hypothetical protein
MTDFFNNITSLSWWIGVVIFTIVLNLAAMYLKFPFDRLLSSISTKYRTRSKAKKAERELKIKNLVGNKHEQILFASQTIFTLVTSILGFLFTTFFVTMGSLVTVLKNLNPVLKNNLDLRIMARGSLIFGLVCMFWAQFKYTKANEDRKILKEAKDRESKIEDGSLSKSSQQGIGVRS